MSVNRIAIVSLFAFALLGGACQQANAQSQCSGRSNDECDQLKFEESDKELAGLVTAALARIDEFAHQDTRQEARDALTEAHRNWISLRALDCQSALAFYWLRSARTRQGFTASCMHALTVERMAELKRRYLMTN